MNSKSFSPSPDCSMNPMSRTPPEADSDVVDGVAISAAADVNDDVLTEILVRLAAKDVTRLKLICKNWLSLISGDDFSHLHAGHHPKPRPCLILQTRTSRFFHLNPIINDVGDKPVMTPYNFSVPNPQILSSCNGMMLLKTNYPQSEYHVYNIISKQSRKIKLDFDYVYPCMKGLNLAFDPSKSPHYKIICVRSSKKALVRIAQAYRIDMYDSVSHTWKHSNSYACEAYDSVSHTWKLYLEEAFGRSPETNFSNGVYCNNSIYWKNDECLLYFDIGTSSIESLPCSEIFNRTSFRDLQLQESNGHLYLLDHDGKSVWRLRGDHHYHHTSPQVFGTLLRFISGSDGDQVLELRGDHHFECWILKHYHHTAPQLFGSVLSFISGIGSKLSVISGMDDDETTGALVTHVPGKISIYKFDTGLEELVDLRRQPFYHRNSNQFDFGDVHHFAEFDSLALFPV